jgi:hypothetical protein
VICRTAQVNGLRGLLAEYGEVMPMRRAGIKRERPPRHFGAIILSMANS